MHLAFQVLYFISAFLVMGVAVILFSQRPTNKIIRTFFLLGVAISGWIVTLFYYYTVSNSSELLVVGRVNYVFAEILIFFALMMVYLFPKKLREWPTWVNVSLVCLTTIIVGLTIGTDLMIKDEIVVGIDRQTLYGDLFWVFIIQFLTMGTYGIWLLIKKIWRFTGKIRSQTIWFAVGWGTAIILGAITNIMLPFVYKYYDAQHYAIIGPVIFVLCLGYVIIKHEMLSIRILTAELMVYVLLLFFVINFALAPSRFNQVLAGIILAAGMVAGFILIRSVQGEVVRRQQLKQLAARLDKTNKELRHLDEMKSEFISIASHQLRTPVSVIKGYLSLIKDGAFGKVGGELEEKLEQIYDMNERLVHLINNLLNISRIEKGAAQFWCSETNVAEIIRRVVNEMKFKIKGKDLVMEFIEPKDDVPNVFVDPERLTEVVVNLIDNAIKYTHAGSITINIEGGGLEKPVTVWIKDTGIGIDAEDMKHVFQKYYRPRRPSEEHKAGLSLGLGLYICAKFLRSMGGDIWVEYTAPGKGTAIGFSLPPRASGVCDIKDGDGGEPPSKKSKD